MSKRYIIPIFVPHKGCPNQCIFCNQKKISGQIQELTANDVEKEINEYLEINKNVSHTEIEVAFYGGSFTGIEYEKQIDLLSVAKKFIDDKKIDCIRLSTRPDYIDENILKYLKEYGVKTIELGVQSMDDHILERSKRGHNSKQVIEASQLINKKGFDLGLQMMVGLPDSNEEIEIETAKKLIELKPKCVRIYPVLVIKDTPLEDEYYNGIYAPCETNKAVEISTKLLQMFEKENITVIRIGLQTTDNINEGRDVIAGPFHPSFGELVKQKIAYDKIEKEIIKNRYFDCCLIVQCNDSDVSKIIGNRKKNLLELKNKYKVNIKVKSSRDISKGQYLITKVIH